MKWKFFPAQKNWAGSCWRKWHIMKAYDTFGNAAEEGTLKVVPQMAGLVDEIGW